jgi:hypothetical protein
MEQAARLEGQDRYLGQAVRTMGQAHLSRRARDLPRGRVLEISVEYSCFVRRISDIRYSRQGLSAGGQLALSKLAKTANQTIGSDRRCLYKVRTFAKSTEDITCL